MKYNWNSDIIPRLESMGEVSGGYSPAQRGFIIIEDGTKLFVKVGTGEQTKKWLAKEVKVYQKLNEAGYPHVPMLYAVNDNDTGMAIEYLRDYSFEDTWDDDKLNAVIEAQEALKPFAYLFKGDEDFSPNSVVSLDNKWPTLLQDESVEWLSKRVPELGTSIDVNYDTLTKLAAMNEGWSFQADTLTHQDIRADNFGYDPKTKTGKLIDWNWLCIGDASLDTTPLFINMYKFGFDPYEKHPEKYDPQMLAYLVSFWLDSILSGRDIDEDRDLSRRQAQAENVRLCLELLERHGY
ncbi:MAG TPA: aminoglycoside phosphotransferase family protein [Candidatus Saccharimonadales bacterium]|jgi:fructosamine-3-kinase